MKRCILMIFILCFSQICNAEEKFSHKNFYYVRAGISISNFSDNVVYTDDPIQGGCKSLFSIGYNVNFGVHHLLNNFLFVGGEVAATTRGFRHELNDDYDLKILLHSLKLTPIMFGIKYNVTNNCVVEGYTNLWVSCDYAGKEYHHHSDENKTYKVTIKPFERKRNKTWRPFDFGPSLGCALWFKHINLDARYSYGLNSMKDLLVSYGHCHTFEISLGYIF